VLLGQGRQEIPVGRGVFIGQIKQELSIILKFVPGGHF
jgi:hypothetical protein